MKTKTKTKTINIKPLVLMSIKVRHKTIQTMQKTHDRITCPQEKTILLAKVAFQKRVIIRAINKYWGLPETFQLMVLQQKRKVYKQLMKKYGN